MNQREYCQSCHIALEEWEWCGRGFCETCEDQVVNKIIQSKIRSLLLSTDVSDFACVEDLVEDIISELETELELNINEHSDACDIVETWWSKEI